MTDSMDLQHATDSVAAKVGSRFVTPALVAVLTLSLTIIGFLIKRAWDDQSKVIDRIETKVETTTQSTTNIDKNIELLAQRVDTVLVQQVEQNKKRIDNHEDRIQKLERSVSTP